MSNETKKYAGLDALQTFLEGCKTLFASITHKHTISDITDYKVDTALSSTSTNPIQNKVINAEFDAISEAMGTLEAAIDDKLDTSMASSTYETKEDAQTKYDNAIAHSDANLETAKNYADTVASGKADASHNHEIADVSGLQSALDGKAASSHGTHVSYSSTAPVMDGTASVGTASTVSRSDHKHPTDTSRASKTEFDSHTGNMTVHITSTERTNWNTIVAEKDMYAKIVESSSEPTNADFWLKPY